MDAERLRLVVAAVCATRNRSPPSRSETKRMIKLMRSPFGSDTANTEDVKINSEQLEYRIYEQTTL